MCTGQLEQRVLVGHHSTYLTNNADDVSAMFEGFVVYAWLITKLISSNLNGF